MLCTCTTTIQMAQQNLVQIEFRKGKKQPVTCFVRENAISNDHLEQKPNKKGSSFVRTHQPMVTHCQVCESFLHWVDVPSEEMNLVLLDCASSLGVGLPGGGRRSENTKPCLACHLAASFWFLGHSSDVKFLAVLAEEEKSLENPNAADYLVLGPKFQNCSHRRKNQKEKGLSLQWQ